MDEAFARRFVTNWLDSWNAHDVDAVLEHFAEDAVFSSPLALRLVDGSNGVVRGKEDLRAYWREGVRRSPDLHFELLDLYVGVDTIVMRYRNQMNGLVSEVLTFDGPLVVEGHATYLVI